MPTDGRGTPGVRRRALWSSVLATVGLLAVAAFVVVGGDTPPAQPARLTARQLTTLFDRYGDTSGRWNGADRTASVSLPDGRRLWLFSDTFLGPVDPSGSRPPSSPFIHNSAIVQDGDVLRETLHGGTPEQPASLVPADRTGEFYWIGDAQVVGDSLQVLVNRYRRTGEGPLDHALLGTALATFALPALTPTGVRSLPLGSRISWGSELLRDGGHTYVYGTEAAGSAKFAHVARVAGDDLTGAWQFWTGSDWSGREDASTRLLSGVGTSYGVQRIAGRYVLVTHENNVVFSPDLVAYTAYHPTGPFTGPEYLHRAPENDAGHIIYDADLHPDLARPGRLLISYNVNNLDDAVTYADASVYRPRFVEVDWPHRTADRGRLPPAPTGLTVAARGAGTAELGWQRPEHGDPLTYQVYRRDVTAGQTHFARYGRPVTEPRFTVDLLVNGHRYEFQVTALNRYGEGRPSPPAGVTATVPPPPAPTGVRVVTGQVGDVVLSWDPVPFVQLFRVYRRDLTLGESQPTLAGTFAGTHATIGSLWHGHRYEFTVVAVGGGRESVPSTPVGATAFVAPPPPSTYAPHTPPAAWPTATSTG